MSEPRGAKGSELCVLVGMLGEDDPQVPAAVLEVAAHLFNVQPRALGGLLVALAFQVLFERGPL